MDFDAAAALLFVFCKSSSLCFDDIGLRIVGVDFGLGKWKFPINSLHRTCRFAGTDGVRLRLRLPRLMIFDPARFGGGAEIKFTTGRSSCGLGCSNACPA